MSHLLSAMFRQNCKSWLSNHKSNLLPEMLPTQYHTCKCLYPSYPETFLLIHPMFLVAPHIQHPLTSAYYKTSIFHHLQTELLLFFHYKSSDLTNSQSNCFLHLHPYIHLSLWLLPYFQILQPREYLHSKHPHLLHRSML